MARHLDEGSLVLYDLSSSYFEGKTCPITKLGHNRDGKKGKLQIEYGLLCNAADSPTLGSQIFKLRQRFGLRWLVLVGDRGMITQARIDNELHGIEGLDWITALRTSSKEEGLESTTIVER